MSIYFWFTSHTLSSRKKTAQTLRKIPMETSSWILILIPWKCGRWDDHICIVTKKAKGFLFFHQIMEKQVKEGRARSIGLSNFNESQIVHISNHSEIKPSNLQVRNFCLTKLYFINSIVYIYSKILFLNHSNLVKSQLRPIYHIISSNSNILSSRLSCTFTINKNPSVNCVKNSTSV